MNPLHLAFLPALIAAGLIAAEPAPRPVALRSALASSTYGDFTAANAIDGVSSDTSRWTSGRTPAGPWWLEVELAETTSLLGVHVHTGLNAATAVRGLTLVKSATGPVDGDSNGIDPGDVVTYSFVVTNTGNVTLSSASIVDDKIANDTTSITCPSATSPSNVIASLAPSVEVTCTADYIVTTADWEATFVTNTATASDGTTTGTDTLSVDLTAPAITVAKSAAAPVDADGNGLDAGDTIAYTFVVTNVFAPLTNTGTYNIAICIGTSSNRFWR
jgi:uncharacterized repeat protein (TIGR01451 family)